MPAIKDLTGLTFSNWTVLARDPVKRARVHWICRCICGAEKAVSAIHLTNGNSRSCGCVRPRGDGHVSFKHGLSDTPLHVLWMGMHNRCSNPAYVNHHGKGIRVCERWNDFLAFADDMGPRPSPRHSIDRINGDGDYEPGNCRWATAKEQARNMSRNVFVSCDGERVTLAEACERKGINYGTAKWRLKHGRDYDAAS